MAAATAGRRGGAAGDGEGRGRPRDGPGSLAGALPGAVVQDDGGGSSPARPRTGESVVSRRDVGDVV